MGCKESKVANKPQSQQTREIAHTVTQENNVLENNQDNEVEPKSKPIKVSNECNGNIEEVKSLDFPDSEKSYVRQALAKFLPDYNVDTIPVFGKEGSIVVMRVLRDRNVILTPDPTAKYLVYGTTETRYTLHLARKNDDPPFFDQDPEAGKEVKCDTKLIQEALKNKDPVLAIGEVLKTIMSDRNGENNGLEGPDFLWVLEGNGENFGISTTDKSMFWEDINDDRIDNVPKPPVKVTENQAKMLHLRFRDT
ncbi:hypothetical protein LOD99_3622 [Oopsacas minuta]|uniref:Uncharacterized protein n=1 Tax=Oopsacas minuta TaxID=111878 RepID=A0AAV7JWN7_9METZ|nr:hypothetical protein LOD99_3622 [Oopsacas minuta]